MEIVWLAFFLMATIKIFQLILKLPQNFILFFSTENRIWYKNKYFQNKYFCYFIFVGQL